MALTPAEKQKAYRERQKAKADREKLKGGDDGAQFYRTPFSEFAQADANLSEIDQYLALAGVELAAFDDERGPESFVIDRAAFGEEPLFGDAEGALGRAEVTIGCLIDAATTLADAVNRYKRNEVEARLAELEQDAEVDRAKAMNEAVRLNKILDQLSKTIRMPIPQWKAMGN